MYQLAFDLVFSLSAARTAFLQQQLVFRISISYQSIFWGGSAALFTTDQIRN
jgi:hypothetical protein